MELTLAFSQTLFQTEIKRARDGTLSYRAWPHTHETSVQFSVLQNIRKKKGRKKEREKKKERSSLQLWRLVYLPRAWHWYLVGILQVAAMLSHNITNQDRASVLEKVPFY